MTEELSRLREKSAVVLTVDTSELQRFVAESIAAIDKARQFTCKARHPAGPDPQDCGWPTCGCDPYADKVITALAESFPVDTETAVLRITLAWYADPKNWDRGADAGGVWRDSHAMQDAGAHARRVLGI